LNLDEIAKELNMSKTNLKRALRIERNLTDSMKELL
jgi:DNA-binding transcriptional regulator GbsR (MarR family)